MDSQSKTTQTVFALKLPVLKTRDYDLWSMRMEQYLTHTNYALWEVIVNGDAPAIASASAGTKGLIPPKTVEQKLARKNELKAKSTQLLAIPDERLLKFHGIEDAKTLWEAIKARNKSDLDTLSMDDLYNNLKVYESEIKGQSSSNSQNVAFVSSENTSSTNEAVNIAHEVSTGSSEGQASSSTYADDVMFSFFANQSNSPQLNNEDLEQIDTDDLEEMDLKWQVAMLTMRVKRFLKKTGRNLNFNGKETVGFDKTKVECYNCHRRGHFTKECKAPRNQENRNGDAPRRAEEGITNFALMAYTSQGSLSSSSSDSEWLYVFYCSLVVTTATRHSTAVLAVWFVYGFVYDDVVIRMFNPIACCTASSRLEVQRSSRYGSMIIIIIVAAWSKVTAARVKSSYYCCKGTFVFL
ncbi:ribonuclease H-like domain-containing protein [Tanacetum coccineum]